MDFLNLDSYSVNLINDYFKYDLDNYNSTFIKAKISELSYFQQLFILLNILENPTPDLDINLSLVTRWEIHTKGTNLHEIEFVYGDFFHTNDDFFRQEIIEIGRKEAQNIAFSRFVSRSFKHLDKCDRLIEIYIFAEKVERKYSSLFKSVINHLEKIHSTNPGSNRYYTNLYGNSDSGSIYSTLSDSLYYMDWWFRGCVLKGFDISLMQLCEDISESINLKNYFSDKEKFILPLLFAPKGYQNLISNNDDFKNEIQNDLLHYIDSLEELCHRFSGRGHFEFQTRYFPNIKEVNFNEGGRSIEYFNSDQYRDILYDSVAPKNEKNINKLKFGGSIDRDLLFRIIKEFFKIFSYQDLNTDKDINQFIHSIYYDPSSGNDLNNNQTAHHKLRLPKRHAHDFIRLFLFLYEKALIIENKTKILTVLSQALKQPGKRDGLGLRHLKTTFREIKIKKGSKVEFDYDNNQKIRYNSNFNLIRTSINSILRV